MTDNTRKTVIEKPTSDGIRTTIIGDSSADVAKDQAPRQAVLERGRTDPAAGDRATVVEQTSTETTPSATPPQAFRSLVRPPMGVLTAFDDGSADNGEIFRLRQSRTTIGRSSCDIQIPHDPDLSATHAEIVHREQDGGHQWHLIDLNSTNGVFVRTNRVVLRNGRELLIGGRRFVFTCQDTIGMTDATDSIQNRSTQKQTAAVPGPVGKLGARLVEQTSGRPGREFSLRDSKVFIGRDAGQCDLCLDDPFLDNIHAQLFQDKQKRWVIRDQKSLNGVWVRIANKLLDPGTEFLLGGQRFRFDVC